MINFLKASLRVTGYLISILVICAAIIFIASQLMTPMLQRYRSDFENYATNILQLPVTIDRVNFAWHQFQPEIGFNKVTVFDKTTNKPLLQIEKVNVLISILQSIKQRKFVPTGLQVSGTDLKINETSTGEYVIEGFPAFGAVKDATQDTQAKLMRMLAWISQQTFLILENIDVHYTRPNKQEYFVTINHLNIKNISKTHTISVNAVLHQTTPTGLKLGVSWVGDEPDLKQIKANTYLYVSGLSLGQWLKDFSWRGWKATEGMVSAKVWSTWDNGAFQKIQTSFNAYDLAISPESNKITHKINRLSGNVGWKKEGDQQIIAGEDILIDLPTHLWPVTSFYLSTKPDKDGSLIPTVMTIGYLDISDAQAFLSSSPNLIPDQFSTLISDLKLKGSIENLILKFKNGSTDFAQIFLESNFRNLGMAAWKQYPGVDNLSGSMQWDGEHGKFMLDSKRIRFQYDRIFKNPFNFAEIKGEMEIQLDPKKTWTISTPNLQLTNNDGSANVTGSFLFPANSLPIANMSASFTLEKGAHITRYLPLQIFNKQLNNWLLQAFLAGEVKSGRAELRGPLKDFPFENKSGTFLITGNVNNVDFRFAPNWPILKNATGKLTFSGDQMFADMDNATIEDIQTGKVHGEILSFSKKGKQILTIQSEAIPGDIAQGLNFIHASPLENTIGKMFADLDLQGPMLLKLGLTIPFLTPEKTQVLGNLSLSDVKMQMVPWNLQLKHLQGQIQFTENSIEAKNLVGELFDQMIKLNLTTIQKKNKSMIQANFTNQVNIKDLENWLALPFTQVVEGTADVKGELNLALNAPIELQLQSDLVGVEVKLPDPYAKKTTEAKDFSLNLMAQESQPIQLKVNYGKLLSSGLVLGHKDGKFNLVGANINLGGGPVTIPTSEGLTITGIFDELNLNEIQKYLTQGTTTTKGISLNIRVLDIHAKTVNIFGQQISQVAFKVIPAENYWNINVESPEISGDIKVPMKFNANEQMTAHFQKIHLHGTALDSSQRATINISSLPSLSLNAENVSYNNLHLGRITFKSIPSNNGMVIQNLHIVSDYANLRGIGAWERLNNEYITKLQGTGYSSNISGLLKSLGFDVNNFILSNGQIYFNLSWHDAPYTPSLITLNGTAKIDIGHGRIVNIGETSGAKMELGRMLSIFSLQTIPRRLSLDFSDVFQSGYSFDSIKGDVNFQNGNAIAKNVSFDGPVAKVSINGRIGLKAEDYDFILSVTPYVTSSIPVAATLLTGQPLIGLAALAATTVMGSPLSKVTTYYYNVTGSWSNPHWQSVSDSNR